jgi:formylglycine-generating enzyme required for sulfatase activity
MPESANVEIAHKLSEGDERPLKLEVFDILDASDDPAQPQFRVGRRVVKVGSQLCVDSYCLRYRPAARRPQPVDTGMSQIGFRCGRRPQPEVSELG